MTSFWHSNVLGRYSPQDKWIGLDFKRLFLDSTATKLTHVHELTHSVLSRSSEYGQATEVLIKSLPYMKHLNRSQRKAIASELRSSQIYVQEGMACIVELSRLRHMIGRQQALSWAEIHFTPEYRSYFDPLLFLLSTSQYYRDSFFSKIANLAMLTGIRREIVSSDLLSKPDELISYLKSTDTNPNDRFSALAYSCKLKQYLPTKDPQYICDVAGVTLHADSTKNNAADFINYVRQFTGITQQVSPSDIRERDDIDFMSEANDEIIIANMNLNLSENAESLLNVQDLLHYKDEIETIMVSGLSKELDYQEELEKLTGRKFEAGLVAFLKTGEKYIYGGSFNDISSLLVNQLSDKTLLVKWGLYKPGANELSLFPGARKPEVVIYNNVLNLQETFDNWFSEGNKAEYIYLSVSEEHPFHILILKDKNEVLHLVNTFANPASRFIEKSRSNLAKADPADFLSSTRHYNNVLCVWGDMPWEVDWYATMLNGKEIMYR